MDQLAKLIAEFCRDIPKTSLDALIDDLLMAATPISQKQIVSRLPNVGLRQKLNGILTLADEQRLSLEAVALAIQSARHAHAAWRKSMSVEMVWTGPSPPNTTLRRTDQAMLEVIRNAKSRLWIVSFAAYRVHAVISEINAASERGVEINLILESSEESDGKLSGDQISEIRDALSSTCRFFVWPLQSRESNEWGHRGLLHAKCALADGKQLFVSSANLTEAAFRRNIELGVLIKSQRHAMQIEHHLQWLLESKTLMKI